MGAVCAGGTKPKSARVGGRTSSSGFSGEIKSVKRNDLSNESGDELDFSTRTPRRPDYGDFPLTFSRELKPSMFAKTADTKVNQKTSFLGKAGTVGLEKAVEVLDTLGSSMSNLNAKSGFVSGLNSKRNKISILAFEVANTIAKSSSLFQSLSDDNVQSLKNEIINSEAVQKLVSSDMEELLIIAAADKREEFNVLTREVIRFGDLCKDPQWHNLDRYFSKLDAEYSTDKQLREEVEVTMQELNSLVQHTSELYHELNVLDRFEQDYQRKLQEVESLNLPRRGESLTVFQSELKEQRKLVRSLKRKSLWSKNLEEIVEKLVDVVTYLHQAILEAFGNNGATLASEEANKNPQKLGPAGLALHYANVINQIDNIASRPTSLPPNIRDTLYNGLPASVKKALRSRILRVDIKEELTIAQVKAEMEKTLQWLVPVVANTTKAHQGFGWVGEWANTGNEFNKSAGATSNLIRLQTLYHANKQKTDEYILELITWLHCLINLVRNRDFGFNPVPAQSSATKGLLFPAKMHRLLSLKNYRTHLSQEDKDMLNKVNWKRQVPGISKTQEFAIGRRRKVWALSRSNGNTPAISEHPKAISIDDTDVLNSSSKSLFD
ncbi:hypothetical protein K2173_027835 [Erythroxylum novogranatense]|uniref:Uncharacterized protein n=1 Tax=Erythroxylum novogranatense TaxID=1862640 RepID=A0AAV8U2S2_9ROSI|nr:hypothetical protein K2173_027835 [Erythroxylum novogranatense]